MKIGDTMNEVKAELMLKIQPLSAGFEQTKLEMPEDYTFMVLRKRAEKLENTWREMFPKNSCFS